MTDAPENITGDELKHKLSEMTESVPVSPTAGLSPQDRHSKRVRRNRAGAASLAALTVGSIVLVSNRESPDAGMVVAAANNTESLAAAPENPVRFNERIVDGVVSYGESIVHADDGTIYVLSTSPDAAWPTEAEMAERDEGRSGSFPLLEQAIYSTTNGENWTITELGGVHLDSLVEREGVLYSLTTSEGDNGTVSASYVSSSDGGATWEGPVLDFGPTNQSAQRSEHFESFSDHRLLTTDTVELALRNTYWQLDSDWLQSQFDVGPDHYPEFDGENFVVRDWTTCEASYAAADGSDGDHEEPSECTEPPIIAEKSPAELGLEGFSDEPNLEIAALRSTDGVNWEPVDVPGDWVMTSGSVFISQDFPEETDDPGAELEPTFYLSTDGVTWTKETSDAAFPAYRELKASLNGQFTSFAVDEPISASESDPESNSDEESESSYAVLFGTSPDGVNWSDTAVTTGVEGPTGSSWPLVQEVGPLGAVVVIQHDDYSNDDYGNDEQTYQDYLDSLSYTIFYSEDGKAWQTVELESSPPGELAYGLVTRESIALTFRVGDWTTDAEPDTKTLLLTPER